MIELKDVHKRFGDLEVLKGITLSVAKGEVVCLIGASGSGKSTMLRCMNGLESYEAGTISLLGKTVDANSREINDLRRQIGMVFQRFNLFPHRTALENVMEGPVYVNREKPGPAREKAIALLTRVGLADKIDVYPPQLSGGQQQRVAIARSLAMEPKAILFDEPTSALDPELVGEVLTVIGDLAKEKRTMILVTHEMKFARDVSSHVVFLHNGVIEEQGPPAQLFGDPKSERLKKFISSIH